MSKEDGRPLNKEEDRFYTSEKKKKMKVPEVICCSVTTKLGCPIVFGNKVTNKG